MRMKCRTVSGWKADLHKLEIFPRFSYCFSGSHISECSFASLWRLLQEVARTLKHKTSVSLIVSHLFVTQGTSEGYHAHTHEDVLLPPSFPVIPLCCFPSFSPSPQLLQKLMPGSMAVCKQVEEVRTPSWRQWGELCCAAFLHCNPEKSLFPK